MFVVQCATPQEFEALHEAFGGAPIWELERRRYFDAHPGTIVLRGSVGAARAAAAAELAIATWSPELIIDFGAAGALVEGLGVGELVVDGDARGLAFAERLPARRGRIATSDREIVTREDRAALARESDAIAVCWESDAIAGACRARGVSFASIRVITDVGDGNGRDGFLAEYRAGVAAALPPAARALAALTRASGSERRGP
jgi:nucleoside phosphorylase